MPLNNVWCLEGLLDLLAKYKQTNVVLCIVRSSVYASYFSNVVVFCLHWFVKNGEIRIQNEGKKQVLVFLLWCDL